MNIIYRNHAKPFVFLLAKYRFDTSNSPCSTAYILWRHGSSRERKYSSIMFASSLKICFIINDLKYIRIFFTPIVPSWYTFHPKSDTLVNSSLQQLRLFRAAKPTLLLYSFFFLSVLFTFVVTTINYLTKKNRIFFIFLLEI